MNVRTKPARQPDETDLLLIDTLQEGFPLTEQPYADVGARFGISGEEVTFRLQRLLDEGVLTRFGPLFQIERLGGAFCLAAMAVPPERWDAVCSAVNALPEVAHNYARTHTLNMWFVLATATPGEIAATAHRIEEATGLDVLLFPKEQEYFIGMKLKAGQAETQ